TAERDAIVRAARDDAFAAAAGSWDAWFARACATVDALSDEADAVPAGDAVTAAARSAGDRRGGEKAALRTVSIVSTSALARGLAAGASLSGLRPAVADAGEHDHAAAEIAERAEVAA